MEMRKYSKAYTLDRLRAFSDWKEKDRGDKEPLGDDAVVYVQDNLTVVEDPFEPDETLYDEISEEWKAFCKGELEFAIPEDLHYAYDDPEPPTGARV